MTSTPHDALVIGAGLSGLSCARTLHRAGLRVLVLEADDDIGGRVRTDHVDGFILDRGFQVLQTAYPEACKALDYGKLRLRPFDPGVAVRKNGRFHIIADPVRRPRHIFRTAAAPVGTLFDKLRVVKLFLQARRRSLAAIFSGPDVPARRFLLDAGFSDDMIQSFFRPFFAGVCLDPDINASRRIFEFIFRMFGAGDAAIPEEGMAAIPRQMAADLPSDCIQTGLRVAALSENGARLADGREIPAGTAVLATEAHEVRRLLGENHTTPYFSETCFYFAADAPPFPHKMLLLNGEGRGPVFNLAVPSQACPGRAPAGKALLAAVVLGEDETDERALTQAVTAQLRDWFGPAVDRWRLLKTYRILRALPDQRPPLPDPLAPHRRLRDNLYVCGEYESAPAIQWALYSGRKTAEKIIAERKAPAPHAHVKGGP